MPPHSMPLDPTLATLRYEVVTPATPGRIVAYGRESSPLFYWVAYTNMDPMEVLVYRVAQAQQGGLFGPKRLKEALLDVLDAGDVPTVTVLVDGITMGEAMERSGDEIRRLCAEGHPLLNGHYSKQRTPRAEPAPEPEPKGAHETAILAFLSDHAWHTTADISSHLHLTQDDLRRSIERLCRTKAVLREKCDGSDGRRGTWRYRLEQPLDLLDLRVH